MSDEQTREEVVNLFYETGADEPLEKPTEATADEIPTEEAEEVEDSTDEADEVEEEAGEELEEDDDNEDTLVYEINGKEYTPEDIEALESGKLMQADYTKKTQAHAEEVKAFNDDKALLETEKAKVSEFSALLEVLVAEDEEIDWADLKEYEPEKYIELKEKADKRRVELEKVKASQANQPKAQALTKDELSAESTDFYSYDPLWLDDKKQLTQKFQDDMTIAGEYLKDSGYSQDEVNGISRSHHWKTIVNAAKYQSQLKKGSALKKKVITPPKVTKPKANNSNTVKSASDIMYNS
tara:strand:- start:2339 stop:3226 length:888 start_codon:yes stop_codon:yes gene_type:complete